MSDARKHPGLAPLVQLNAYIRERAATRGVADGSGLASVERFRRSWERGQALDAIDDALARKPANAGPLNSHVLVLQLLDTLRELSPDYLRRTLVQLDALQWLEQARDKYPPAKSAKAKARRRK